MITGFEKQTYKLITEEVEMIPHLVDILQGRIGKGRAITSKEIEGHFESLGFKCGGPRVRKMIHFIRVTRRVKNLIATTLGYYVAQTPQELQSYIKSLEERIDAIECVKNSFRNNIVTS